MKKRKHAIHIPKSTTKICGMEFMPESKHKLIEEEKKLRSKK